MYRSGLIVGGVSLLLALGVTLLTPCCVPVLALLLGLGAGYLAGVFDKPASRDTARKNGAIAGAIGGMGALLGEMIGAVINANLVGPAQVAQMMQNLGLPTAPGMLTPHFYWTSVIGLNFCLGALAVLVMAGLGLLGGQLWYGRFTANPSPRPPTFPI